MILFIGIGIIVLLGCFFLWKMNFSTDVEEEVDFSLLLEEEKEETIETVDQKLSYSVDIKGEVLNPGVYMLEDGKRVVDAIELAGGLTTNADTSVNNLSRKVFDEMVIVIYSKEEVEKFASVLEKEEKVVEEIQKQETESGKDAIVSPEEKEPSVSSEEPNNNFDTSGKISLNSATVEELMKLDGIGEKKALAIIQYRQENGSFTAIEELMNVNGIGEKIYQQIKDRIVL